MSERRAVSSPSAPAAIGPYSPAILAPAGRLLYCSGQIALDPTTGALAGAGDVRAETRQVMQNIAALLDAAGASFADVVKTTIFLVDMGDFAAVNEIYGASFAAGVAPPARTTVAVSALPRGGRVEIEVIAVVPG